MRSYPAPILLIFALFVLCANAAGAWLVVPVSDPDLVHHAELIVVAHVKDGSIVYVPHPIHDGGMSWEHHATLIVTEVIKGTYLEKELPIIMHYGLDPRIENGEYFSDSHEFSDDGAKKYLTPDSSIGLYEQGEAKIISDIRKDKIWFLRVQQVRDKKYEGDDSTAAPGIWDPEDVQPLDLKPYFQAFLGEHPEEKLKGYTDGESPLAIRSRVYLDHLKIAEILKEPDPVKRADLLLPFFLYGDERRKGPTQSEAGSLLGSSCGQAGAARLVPVFHDPDYAAMQFDIIGVWVDAQYHEAVPILIDVLKKENEYWEKQTPEERDRWVNMSPYHAPTEAQGASMRRIEYVLMAFKQLADPRTKPILEETKKYWETLGSGGLRTQFPAESNEALLSIQNERERKQGGK